VAESFHDISTGSVNTAGTANAIPAAFIAWAQERYSLSPKSCWASEPIRAEWEASQQDHAA